MNELKQQIFAAVIITFCLLMFCSVSIADWDPCEPHKMHFPQLPKQGGYDVAFNLGRLADDWRCSQTGPIENIHFWISWQDDQVGTINGFSIRIWSDSPDPDEQGPLYSEPNELLWERDFDIGQFTVRDMPDDLQGWFDPLSGASNQQDHNIWQQINVEDINDPYDQNEGTIYWLEIDMWGAPNCGWKESGSPHFNDDAVAWETSDWIELRDPETTESMDLAFVIDGPQEQTNIKWVQLPDLSPQGIDIRIDRSDGIQRIMADDFLCTTTGLITGVRLWGSWKFDDKANITKIHLSLHKDDPIGPGGTDPDNNFSKPDQLLWEMDVEPHDVNENLHYKLPDSNYEWWWDIENGILIPNGDTEVWRYDIDIDPCDAFLQKGSEDDPIIYWLDVYVETDGGPQEGDSGKFGWKTRKWPDHYQDDAVYANEEDTPPVWMELLYPAEHPYDGNSIDMAFVIITSEQEPDKPIKYIQRPDVNETGIDVDASLDFMGMSQWGNQLLADDFPCTRTDPITDIHVWGSWYHAELPEGDPNNVPFMLGIHADLPVGDPCNPYDYSIPGEVLWTRDFLPGEFVATVEAADITEGYYVPCEPFYEPDADWTCWRYDFYIDPCEAFVQQGDPCNPVVYWLSVQAGTDSMSSLARFGWKTSYEHWNDKAVWAEGDTWFHNQWQELRYPI
ncbi:MAG: DUF7901 domain-containing protein, partial [Planctomycetota bacterium]